MFCADLAYLPHWETQMDLLVKSHFDCFEHVLSKNSKGSDVSFGNLLVTLLIYINMSCKLKKNYTIENDHKILTQRIVIQFVYSSENYVVYLEVDLRHHIAKDLCILILSNSSMNNQIFLLTYYTRWILVKYHINHILN